MTPDKKPLILLWPVAAGGGGTPGSMQIEADCGHLAWIAPSGLQLQLSMKIGTLCVWCADPDDVETAGMVPIAAAADDPEAAGAAEKIAESSAAMSAYIRAIQRYRPSGWQRTRP